MQSVELLVKAARLGDSEAVAALVDRYQRAAVTTAWAITKDFHLAQDIAQDCFVSAFARLDSLKINEAFGRWLLISVRRVAWRVASRHSKRLEYPIVDVIEAQPEWLEQFADILILIDRLPVHEQEVVRLRYLSDLPIEEIAVITHRPIGTVSKQISRALARLRSFVVESKK